jgi:hypothetical protein
MIRSFRPVKRKCAVNHRSFLSDDLLDVLKERRAIDHSRGRIVGDPLFADHSLGVNEEERPVGDHRFFVQYAIAPNNLSLRKIAE